VLFVNLRVLLFQLVAGQQELLISGCEIMEAGNTKSSQGLDDASDEGVEVRRGWGAGCSGLGNEFEVIEVKAATFHDQVELAGVNAEQLACSKVRLDLSFDV